MTQRGRISVPIVVSIFSWNSSFTVTVFFGQDRRFVAVKWHYWANLTENETYKWGTRRGHATEWDSWHDSLGKFFSRFNLGSVVSKSLRECGLSLLVRKASSKLCGRCFHFFSLFFFFSFCSSFFSPFFFFLFFFRLLPFSSCFYPFLAFFSSWLFFFFPFTCFCFFFLAFLSLRVFSSLFSRRR